jgi:predicted small lipoprotein YifL
MQTPRRTVTAPFIHRAALSLTVLLALGGCGFKGPLYLPPPPAPEASLTTPPAASPAPSSPETGDTGDTDAPASMPVQ